MPDEMIAVLMTAVVLIGFVCWVPCLKVAERRMEAWALRRVQRSQQETRPESSAAALRST